MNIETMIAEAQARRDAQVAEVARQKQERQSEMIRNFQSRVEEIFGERLLDDFGVMYLGSEYGDTAYARLFWKDVPYTLSDARHGWALVRMDPRSDGDERDRQRTDVYAHYANSKQDNQDALLLGMADLSERQDTPRTRMPEHAAAHIQTTEERLLEVLREYVRECVYDLVGGAQ